MKGLLIFMNEDVLFNAVLEATHEAILIIDNGDIAVKCNQKLQEMIGLPAETIIGSPIDAIMPGLDCDKEISNYEIKSRAKSFITRKVTIPVDKDCYKVLFLSDNHFNMELGNRYAEIKVLKDIYESILNSIDEGIHVADINGHIKFINPSQKELDGLTETVIGRHWKDVYNLDENTSYVLRSLIEGKSFYDIYQNYVTSSGKYVSIVCSSVPLYSEGKLIGAAAITKDFLKYKDRAEKILDFHENNGDAGRVKNHRGKPVTGSYTFEQIIGKNRCLLDSIKWGKAGAKSDSAVLIYGETGTGKEMFAQSIHAGSGRSGGPFLALNCAAIPENLLEGILFGTTRGVFTGAVDRAGLIEQAGGGTLFLDEINSMPPVLQSKLLRVVEEKVFMRLGGKEEISVDLRIFSSCNIEPSKAIEEGQLRNDLFYRLAVIYIYIPPLRDRLDDLEILTGSFIEKYNSLMSKKVTGVTAEVMEMFHRYSWPGNVRQLMHCIECAMNLLPFDERIIKTEHIPEYLLLDFQQDRIGLHSISRTVWDNGTTIFGRNPESEVGGCNIIEEIKEQEKEEIIIALKRAGGNITRAASSLGMSRQRLHYRLKKYNLK